MVSILFLEDDQLLATAGAVRRLLDPACGTGGMLAEAQNYLRELHGAARLFVYGQDYNKRAFATAASDMLMKQVDHNSGQRQYSLRRQPDRRPVQEQEIRLLPHQSALRRELEEAKGEDQAGAGPAGLRRPLRTWATSRERWFTALSVAHVGQAQARSAQGTQAGFAARHRLQRISAIHRRCGDRARARSAGGSSRPIGLRP